MAYKESSLGTSFTSNNNHEIPWYVNKDNQNVDLYGSRRSKISQRLNPAWISEEEEPIRKIMSQRVTPEPFDNRYDNNQKRGLDVNRYATKKTIAQGMLDVALLTANASQLKYVLQLGEERHEFYHLMLALIILSIVLQAIVALFSFSLNFLRDCRLEQETYKTSALVINYFSLGLVFLTSTLNVLIAGLDPRTQI